jgi:PAS domain S-box-containing protein
MSTSKLTDIEFGLLEHLDTPATIIDSSGRIAVVNTAAEQARGMPRERLTGEYFLNLLPDDRRLPSGAEFARTVERGETAVYESAFEVGSERFETCVVLAPIRVHGIVVGALALGVKRHPAEREPPAGPLPQLTPRQYQVLTLMAAALSTEEIASELSLSPETIRNHIRAALTKLGAHSRLEAIVVAEKLGLIQLPNPREGEP